MPHSARRCLLVLLVVGFLGAAQLAAASSITASITVGTDSLLLMYPNSAASLTISQTAPAIGQIGIFGLDITYTVPGPPEDLSVSTDTNVLDPSGPLHDTLALTWTLVGNSVTADVIFTTRSLDGISPPALPGASDLTATGAYAEIVSIDIGDEDPFVMSVSSGIDASAVPEPGTLTLIGAGVGLAALARRLRSA